MPDYWPRDKKAESFAYIGRDRHTTLHVALSILVVGLLLIYMSGNHFPMYPFPHLSRVNTPAKKDTRESIQSF